ncbi:MAG: glycosyltransferase family 2 protein [Tractidigestivibacter sp.]|uniref:glycosyltransferase family 2 protein n=1 Tax=Tractidigestivibacter sp. TaxID=2847320 RepID=UPI002A7F5EE8|nr:glycosyltransferase family 2 protein [Tractidigestivibacter sp.]MDY4535277.1 glycosyltransferase family 2 protein [Tractidigestivibacter sp.]
MTENPTIAAIVPVYNAERYLGQCVNSLLCQTYPLTEIVLVDDGSSDSSPAMCDEYASEYPCVRVVHKQNGGLGYARNTGLEHVGPTIDYVTFIDSDDWLEKNMLELLVTELISSESDTVLAGFVRRDDDGRALSTFQLENKTYEGTEIQHDLLPRVCGSAPDASDSLPMSVCASLLSTKIIRDGHLSFPSERDVLSEDYFFKYLYLCRAKKVRVSSCTGYCYRYNRKSLTTSYRPDRFEASLHFYQVAKALAEKGPAADDCIMRLQKSLFIYARWSIAQEAFATSGHTAREATARIREIISNHQLQMVISEYPIERLGISQRLFISLSRCRCAAPLYLLARWGVFAESS